MTNRQLDRREFLNWTIPAGLGLCSCFGCRTTPITQRRQLLLVPESQEVQMGVAAYQEVKTKNKISTNAKYKEVVDRVGQRLAEAAARQNLGKNFDWEFTSWNHLR